MLFGLLILLTALTISGVAIYYSVAGLVAIFAAAAIPIIIMGSALEVGKLVAAMWLHRYWDRAGFLLKAYLSIAVIVLMLITSMGIFGFLSKAHIEQTAGASENFAQIQRIDADIARQQTIITRAEDKIAATESKGTNNDTSIQDQIDKEQARIDSAYSRIQPAIDEQNLIINDEEAKLAGGLDLYQQQLLDIDTKLTSIETLLSSNDIKSLQSLIGVKADGDFGSQTRIAVETFKQSLNSEKIKLSQLIAEERAKITSPVIDAAREEIKRLRSIAEQQIADSDALIARLRSQLGAEDKTLTDQIIQDETAKITAANSEIDQLTEQKYTLEVEYRKLEAEVGPVKYLAEFIYGVQSDTDILESAVRWVIVVIIFVFDPLAVVLLIASQYTFMWAKQDEPPVPPPAPAKLPRSPRTPKSPREYKVELHSDIAYPDTMPPVPNTSNKLKELLKRADPETIEEVMQQLAKKETVDTTNTDTYNNNAAEKVYGLDGKLVNKAIKSIKIKNKDE